MKSIRKYINKITLASVLLFACLICIFTITTKAETQTSDFGTSYEIIPPNNEYGNSHINSIGGMSYKINQLVKNGNFIDTANWTQTRANLTVNNNIATITSTVENNTFRISQGYKANPNDKMMVIADIKSATLTTATFNGNYMGGGAIPFTITTTFSRQSRIYTISTSSTGINDIWISSDGGTDVIVGSTIDVKNVMLFNLTVMGIDTTDVATATNELLKRGIDINTYQANNTGSIRDSKVINIICKDSNNTTIDTLTIPQDIQMINGYGWGLNYNSSNTIDFINNKFIKRTNRIDLSTLEWNGSNGVFESSIINDKLLGSQNILCDIYTTSTSATVNMPDFSIKAYASSNGLVVKDSDFTSGADLKDSLENVYLYYELATPIETDITSYIETYELNYVSGTTITFENEYQQAVPYWIVYYGEPISTLYTNYNNLQQQFETLQQNYNTLNEQYTGLQQAFTNLENAFEQYRTNHTYSNTQYNLLLQLYNNLNDTYNQLQQDYNDLQSRYDILLSEYNKIYYNQNHGFWNYINNVDFYSGEYHSGLKTLDDLLNDEIITYLNFDLALGFREYVESIPSYVYVDVDFIDNVVPISVFNIKVVDIITPYTFSFTLYDKLNDDTVVVSVSTQDVPNNYISGYEIMKAYFGNDYTVDEYNDAVERNPYVYIQDFLLDSTYSTSGEVYDPSLESGIGIDGDSYQYGYNQGYATAYSNYVDTFATNSQLETQNAQLSFQVSQLQNDITITSSAYQSLLSSYNNLVEGRSDLPTLFFTIAQTPFETFKTIWNVDFLGINLAGFFTGIIMLGLMLWIVKKIF